MARARHQHDLPRQRTFLHRSALVVGGGIAGMTAAEELAGSGIEVHLVERQPSLGGYMARLSKTFPTEDCAMCSLAPRLTSTALESRVHVHTLTEVEDISGPPGEFRVTLRHKPRYVSEACVGCGECVPVCPVKYANDFDFGVSRRKAIDRPVRQRRARHVRRREEGLEPVQERLRRAHLRAGLRGARRRGPLRGGLPRGQRAQPFQQRLRPHLHAPLRDRLRPGKVDEPVAIAGIKRFVADTVGPALAVQAAPVIHDETVAIVGAGPAGITCARDLAPLGYKVTVFEAQPVAGGMLRLGIPDYRLPHEVIQREIDQVLALGIELRARPARGRGLHGGRPVRAGYKAVYLATGLQKSAPAPLPGRRPARRDARRRAAARAEPGRHARRRRKAVVDRRRRRGAGRRAQHHPPAAAGRRRAGRHAGLPAHQGRDAGQRQRGRRSPRGRPEGRVPRPAPRHRGQERRRHGIKLQRCELGEPDGSGRRQPVAVEGSEFELEADTIVFAVGQALVDDFAQGCDGLALEDGQICIDRDTMMTTRDGVFAGGDAAALGFYTAIEAVAAGRRGAPPSTTSCAASGCCRCGTTSARSPVPATRSSPPSPSGSACP